MIDIHPSSLENFNKKANNLITTPEEIELNIRDHRFKSDLYISATVTDEDIIGEIQESTTDPKGRTIERFFFHNGKKYRVSKDNYADFIALAESIQRLSGVREKLSFKFVEDTLFDWVKNSYINKNSGIDFISHLKALASKKIASVKVMVPIANLIIESPFQFCGAEIISIDSNMFDKWIEDALINCPPEHAENVSKYFNDLRREIQGYSAILLELICERHHAEHVAAERAAEIMDLLNIFNGPMLLPDFKSYSRIKGSEDSQTTLVLMEQPDGLLNVTRSIVDQHVNDIWQLSKLHVLELQQVGLNTLSKLILSQKKTGFHKSILNMAFLYSKAAFTNDPIAKVVYVLSALESMLLKSSSEPIQQNLSERIAIFSAEQLDKRKAILRNIKTVYGLRSNYLHHGHSISEIKEIKEFLYTIWLFFVKLLQHADAFQSKDEFLEWLDDHKLS